MLPLLPALPAKPTRPIVVQMISPKQDEVATSELFNSFIKTVPAFSLVNLTGLTINAEEGPLIILDRSDITFLGGKVVQLTNGSGVSPKSWLPRLELNWPRNRAFWHVTRCTRISWINTVIEGANNGSYLGQMYEEQGGFVLRRCFDITIMSPRISGTFGDCITLIHEDASRLPCERVEVCDIQATNIGRNFMAIVSGVDVSLNGVLINKTGRSGFNIEPAVEANVVSRVFASNVSATAITGALIGNLGVSNNVSDITCRDMRLTDKPVLISCQGRSDKPGQRARYLFDRISGGGKAIANGTSISIGNIDDVTVRDITQKTAGYLADSAGKVIYKGVGLSAYDINNLLLERVEFPKGVSVAKTGEVTPWVLDQCSSVTVI